MAKSLDELKGRLLFQNSVDVWIALCRERGWDWRVHEKYSRFIEHLRGSGVELRAAPQGHPIRDVSGKPLEAYTIRFDARLIGIARQFA